MFPGEEKGIVTSPGHKFELHYHILLKLRCHFVLPKNRDVRSKSNSDIYINLVHLF